MNNFIFEMDGKKKVSFAEDVENDEKAPEENNREGSHSARHRKRSRAVSKLSMSSTDSNEETVNPLTHSESVSSLAGADRLHNLILEGDQEAAVKLINKGNDTNKQDRSGKTPLHTAILSKQYNIVEKLLECGANVTISDDTGDTPLHTAIHVGSEKLVLMLIHQGKCSVEALGRNGATPLHLAAEMDNNNICKILVENRAELSPTDADLMTPIAQAMERGAVKSAKYLLETAKQRRGSVEDLMYNVDIDGSSLLHLATNSGVLGVVELSVLYGARIRQPRRTDKMTAFHLACEQGLMPIIEFLVSKDPAICRITLVDYRGKTPLHFAAGKNHIQVLEYLLENGAVVDPKDDERRTPLFMAASYGASSAVHLLMERGADVTIRDTSLRSVLHAGVGDVKSMEALLQSPAAVVLITEKDDDGFSPVHYAAKRGDIKNIKLLVSKNRASSSVLSKGLDTPIHVAARYGWTDAIEALMDNQNAKIINMQNSQGKTALHFACSEGHDYTAETLLKLGAVIERDQTDRTPLHLAATKGALRCCKLMVEKFTDHINDTDKNKNTPLHLAATHGHPAVLNYLLSNQKAHIVKNSSHENILDIAARSEQREVAAVIAKHERWDEALKDCSTALGPLMKKMIINMPEVAVFFLDQCVEEKGDPNSENYVVNYDLNLIQGHYPGEDIKSDKSSLQLIETMAQHRRERCLTHPVSFVLLNTKWKKFGWLTFSVNLFSYFCFIIPLTALAVHERNQAQVLCGNVTSIAVDESRCTFKDLTVQLLSVTVIVATTMLILKHILALFRKRMAYVLNVLNIVEWICYVAALVFVIPPCDCKLGGKLEVGAVALFFGWMNLILYFRRLSSYGQYVIMLTTMFATLVKVLVLWMLFIMAFGTTFYMIMDEESFSAKFGYSMFSMFVMTMGELNYHDDFMPWENLPFATLTNILFIVLVLGMPIIMMNMLIGLAVGDIDKIQQNALMDRYVLQVQLLLDIERTLPLFILKRVQVHSYADYPNANQSFVAKLVALFVSFGKAEVEEEEGQTEVSPGMQQIIGKLEQQEKRVEKMYEMVKDHTDIIKELNQISRLKQKSKEEKKEESRLPGFKMFGF